jgi:hypothetical protein
MGPPVTALYLPLFSLVNAWSVCPPTLDNLVEGVDEEISVGILEIELGKESSPWRSLRFPASLEVWERR